MTAQDIYLSPREILNHLLVIEGKIPHRSFTLYRPSTSPQGAISTEQLVREAKLMTEFAGLDNYAVDVKYVQLDKGIGGNISLNNTAERTIHINVSNEFQTNWKATVAVLAHEICHKVLFVNGLYYAPPFTTMNEVYVDLATIYIGFGQVVMDGYITQTQNITSYLGYLTFNTYKVTHFIVCTVLGNIGVEREESGETDLYADIAIGRWTENPNKTKLLNTYFMKQEEQMAELHRNIGVLEQILNQFKKDLTYDYDILDQKYFKSLKKEDGTIKSPLAAFSTVYEFEFYKESISVKELNKAINNAIYDLFIEYQKQRSIEIHYDFSCPFCGKSSKNTTVENRSTIMKCPNCNRHYTYNGEHWNVTRRQRELDDARRRRQQLFYDEVNKRERIIQYKADATIKEIRENEQQRTKEKLLADIPIYLRWLVKKFISL